MDAPGPSAPCSWIPAPGFTTGETLIWAEDAFFSGSGPLTVTFLAQFGGGAYIQSTGDLQYTARLKAFNGASLLGVNTITSNAQGDPVFLGVVDSTQEITGLEFSLTNCTSTSGFCDATDFAVGTLSIYNATPEPSSMLLALGGLVALSLTRRKN